MQLLSKKHISTLLFLAVGSIHANNESSSRLYYEDHNDAPLSCGCFDVQLQAGIAPIVWKDKGATFGAELAAITPTSVILQSLNFPKFKEFFHTPWTIGMQAGYAYTDNLRLYAEFNYAQASAKKPNNTTFLILPSFGSPAGSTLNIILNHKYQLFDFHVGSQYYFNRWWDIVSLFLGAKVGVVHHRRIGFSLQSTVPGLPLITIIPQASNALLFKSKSSVSGGLNLGFDFCLSEQWNILIAGEVVASCGPKVNPIIPTNPSIPLLTADILITPVGTELRFPVTAAIRFNF